MGWGVKIVNTSGTVLIDSRFASLAMRASGVIQSPGGWGVAAAAIGYSASAGAIVAIRCASRCLASISGSTVTVRSEEAATVYYYVFDAPPAPAPGWAMVVRNPDTGQITFDSRHKYATVYGTRSGNSFGEWQGSQTLPAGRDYAVAILRPAETHVVTFVKIGDPQLSEYRYTDNMTFSVSRVSGNVIDYSMGAPTVGVKELFITGTSGTTRNYEKFFAAVIDVTGY